MPGKGKAGRGKTGGKLNQDQPKLDFNSQLEELQDISKLENMLKELVQVPQYILQLF